MIRERSELGFFVSFTQDMLHIGKPELMTRGDVTFSFLNPVAALALALAQVAGCHAQTKASPATPLARVVVSLPRTTYKVGETIEATATLENAGKENFYVPNRWGYSTGGLPGFEIEIQDHGGPFCQVIADYICSSTGQKKMRHMSLDRILDEHFLLLPPGGLIGTKVHLRTSCPFFPRAPVLPPGKYQVTVAYWTNDPCVPDLSNRHAKFPILQMRVAGAPIEVDLTE